MTSRAVPQHRRRNASGSGPEGNERLTAMTGAVLLIGFAVEGATILELHRLLWLHFAVGLLLIGPVLLKIGSTSYRFFRYYSGAASYVRKGPPAPLLRILGPLVICTSLGVLGTGVMLAVVGPQHGSWLFLHKVTFILWFGVMTIHVVAYAPRLPRLLLARHGGPQRPSHRHGQKAAAAVPGSPVRWLLIMGSLAAGVLIAAVTMHMSTRWGVRL